MSVDRTEVERIASLSRIPLDEDEVDRLSGEMNRILEHADRLRERASVPGPGAGAGAGAPAAGGASVPPGERAAPAESGMRHAGAERPDPLRRGVDSFAPRVQDGFFVVPPPQGVTAEDAEGPA